MSKLRGLLMALPIALVLGAVLAFVLAFATQVRVTNPHDIGFGWPRPWLSQDDTVGRTPIAARMRFIDPRQARTSVDVGDFALDAAIDAVAFLLIAGLGAFGWRAAKRHRGPAQAFAENRG